MELREIHETWDGFGRKDPLWAILSSPGTQGNNWDTEDFFKTGVEQVTGLRRVGADFGFRMAGGQAMDFGCGAGRLTQALAEHFEHSVGVDISEAMVDLARKHNKYGDRVEYRINQVPDLSQFPSDSFDYVQTFIVLQHLHPEHQAKYLKEFVRILKPGGELVFQIPAIDRRGGPPDRMDGWVPFSLAPDRTGIMRMLTMPLSHVSLLMENAGMDVVGVLTDMAAGEGFNSHTYYVTKNPAADPSYASHGFAGEVREIQRRTDEKMFQAGLADMPAASGSGTVGTPEAAAADATRRSAAETELRAMKATRVWRMRCGLLRLLGRG